MHGVPRICSLDFTLPGTPACAPIPTLSPILICPASPTCPPNIHHSPCLLYTSLFPHSLLSIVLFLPVLFPDQYGWWQEHRTIRCPARRSNADPIRPWKIGLVPVPCLRQGLLCKVFHLLQPVIPVSIITATTAVR